MSAALRCLDYARPSSLDAAVLNTGARRPRAGLRTRVSASCPSPSARAYGRVKSWRRRYCGSWPDAAMYAAFGVSSPFLPPFLQSRGLNPEQTRGPAVFPEVPYLIVARLRRGSSMLTIPDPQAVFARCYRAASHVTDALSTESGRRHRSLRTIAPPRRRGAPSAPSSRHPACGRASAGAGGLLPPRGPMTWSRFGGLIIGARLRTGRGVIATATLAVVSAHGDGTLVRGG